MNSFDSLFDMNNMKKKEKEFIEKDMKYNFIKVEGGAIYLRRADSEEETAHVIITNEFRKHFIDMGDRDYLINEAYELYEKLRNE